MIELAISIIILIAIVGVIYWFTTKVPLPAPASYVLWAVVAIVALIFLARLGGYGGGSLPSLH